MSAVIHFLVLLCLIVIGGIPCVFMLVGMPVLIIWKIYRKCRYHLSLYD